MGNYVLAHDLGTTGNKASLYDREGVLIGSAFFGYETEYAHTSWAEQNPDDWWQAICKATRRMGVRPEAAERAISHPLLEDISIAGARGVLMNITATSDMEFEEVAEASEYIHSEVGEDAEIFWGTSVDDNLGDEMRVTVIATGIGKDTETEDKLARPLRGRIRDILPDDLDKIVDYDEPTFIRQKRAVGESSRAVYRGTGGTLVNDNDLDVPTFLRRKAD